MARIWGERWSDVHHLKGFRRSVKGGEWGVLKDNQPGKKGGKY